METSGTQRPAGPLTARWVWTGRTVLVFVALVAVCTGCAWWGATSPGAGATTGAGTTDPLFRYDSGWYAFIATHGYFYHPGEQSAVAFFPVYPMLARAVAAVVGHPPWVLHVLAALAGLAALLLVGRWARAVRPDLGPWPAVLALACYPYAVFLYGPSYADSLFLALACGAFLALERRHWWWAGLLGALATATRPLGAALVVGLVLRALELRTGASGRATPREMLAALRSRPWPGYAVLLSMGGLAAYMVFLWRAFGDPLAFVQVEAAPGWDQGTGPRTWFKIGYFGQLASGRWDLRLLLTAQALMMLGAVVSVPAVWRRLGWGYAGYVAAIVAIPLLGTKDFMGAGRYLLAAFPAFAVTGWVVAESGRGAGAAWRARVALAASCVGLAAAAFLLGRGIEIS